MGVGRVSPGGRAAIFLDRDGTINRAFMVDGISRPPMTEARLEVLPGVADALVAARAAGFVLVVVTNQPDVARGTLPREEAERINAAIRRRLPVLDGLACCFHDDGDCCECRKPAPGMLLSAAAELGIDLTRSYMVGDSWRDWEAGRRAGCTTVQVGSEVSVSGGAQYAVANLVEAVQTILRLSGAKGEASVENLRR